MENTRNNSNVFQGCFSLLYFSKRSRGLESFKLKKIIKKFHRYVNLNP